MFLAFPYYKYHMFRNSAFPDKNILFCFQIIFYMFNQYQYEGNIIIISCSTGTLLWFSCVYLIFVLRRPLPLRLRLFFMTFSVFYFLVIICLTDFPVPLRLRKFHFHCIFYSFILEFIPLLQHPCFCQDCSFFDPSYLFFFIFKPSHSFLPLNSVVRQLSSAHHVTFHILLMILNFLPAGFRSAISHCDIYYLTL